MKYIEANRAALEAAPFGLYGVVPPSQEYKIIAPASSFASVNRTAPIGTLSPALAKPSTHFNPTFWSTCLKTAMSVSDLLNPSKFLMSTVFSAPARTFHTRTSAISLIRRLTTVSKMEVYGALLRKAVDSIAVTFRKRVATGLLSGRSFVLPAVQDQVSDQTDFELITWLVVR